MNAITYSIISAIFFLLLSIIGFFIVRHFKQVDENKKQVEENRIIQNGINNDLRKSIEKLSMTITTLNAHLMLQGEKDVYFEKIYLQHQENCKEHFEYLEKAIEK